MIIAGSVVVLLVVVGIPILRIAWASRDPMPSGPAMATCGRCKRETLEDANFCPACGLMLRSHNQIAVWMIDQRDMLRLRESIDPRRE